MPLKIAPSAKQVAQPELTYVKKSSIDYFYLTHGEVAGRGQKGHLTESGQRLMRLLIWPD